MSKKAYVFLTTGFEETEMVTTVDILRRGGVNVYLASLEKEKTVASARDILVTADILFSEADDNADAIIFPGGKVLDGYTKCGGLAEFTRNYYKNGKIVAAICAAPVFLHKTGILDGKNAACYPSMEDMLTNVTVCGKPTVRDGNIITSKGPATSMLFALEILEVLNGEEAANQVAEAFLFQGRRL